jgi:RNA polymerase-binding transcription factor DksA
MFTRLEAARAATSPMSAEQLDRLHRLLVEERVLQQARAVELQDPPDLEPDLADVLLARCREALDEIAEAMALLGQGLYGSCSACGTAIPYERLEAVPWARRCVSCQAGRNRILR